MEEITKTLFAIAFLAIIYLVGDAWITHRWIESNTKAIYEETSDCYNSSLRDYSNLYRTFLKHMRDEHGLDLWNDDNSIKKYGKYPPEEIIEQAKKEAEAKLRGRLRP